MQIDFTKRKAELDAQYKDLDQKRLSALNLANEIWGEQLKLQGRFKMLEDLETAGREVEQSKKADEPIRQPAEAEQPVGAKKKK